MTGSRKPGWDAQVISRIARDYYGGMAEMFEAQDWPERGAAMMPAQQSRVAETYGNVEAFAAAHESPASLTPQQILDGRYSVMLTSFWGWTPETWGKVGFTVAGRRETIVSESSDPLVMFVYVTKSAKGAADEIKGQLVGFYLLSHRQGHRNEFTDARHHGLEPKRWTHALQAVRAFSIPKEYWLSIDEFDKSVNDRAQAVGMWAEDVVTDRLERLRRLPFVETPVFGGGPVADGRIHAPPSPTGRVRGGTVNRTGYWVDGEPADAEKELYVLKLAGDVSAFIGDAAVGLDIYKIGLSTAPSVRRDAFNKSLPGERFRWNLHKSTRMDGDAPYAGFETALAGEDAMKDSLAGAQWLGGEFYAAAPEDIEAAWQAGRDGARGRHA
jgi:hypothetical protein